MNIADQFSNSADDMSWLAERHGSTDSGHQGQLQSWLLHLLRPPAVNEHVDTPLRPATAETVYYNRPGVAVVKWDVTSNAAHMEWQGWANSTEYREANDAIILALRANRGSKLLGDSRGLKVIQKADQEWSNQDWFPRALAAGLMRMALVIPASGLAKMNVDQILSRVPGTELEMAYFATLDEARQWLGQPGAISEQGG